MSYFLQPVLDFLTDMLEQLEVKFDTHTHLQPKVGLQFVQCPLDLSPPAHFIGCAV